MTFLKLKIETNTRKSHPEGRSAFFDCILNKNNLFGVKYKYKDNYKSNKSSIRNIIFKEYAHTQSTNLNSNSFF